MKNNKAITKFSKYHTFRQISSKNCKKVIEKIKHMWYTYIENKDEFDEIEKGITMYNAVELAKYIVSKCTEDACPISNLQLQKILYHIQKEFLKRGSLAFSDDIEAWQFGPVVPNVYYRFSGFGSMLIMDSYNTNIVDEDKEIIDKIVLSKRVLNPWELVEETHKSGGAWDLTYKDGKGNHQIIQTDLIKREN